MEIFRIFLLSSGLISYNLGRSATWEATCIYQFITNNHVSFQLRWKKNLLNHEKVPKFYEHDFISLTCFKSCIGKWKPNCPCRLCKSFLQHVSTAVLTFRFFEFNWSLYYLFMFLVHIDCMNFSCLIYLGICLYF